MDNEICSPSLQAFLLPLSPSLLYISSLLTAELVVPSQVENGRVLKDPMLRRPGGAEAVLVLPVVAIERNIPVLYGIGGVLSDTRIISNRTRDFVVDPPADNDSTATIARGMLAGCCSNGMVLIVLVGDLIAPNHVVGVRGDARDGNVKDGEIVGRWYGIGVGNKFKGVSISSTEFGICTGAHGF
jgi:hypothetical protein